MPAERTEDRLRSLVREFSKYSTETEWVEFKENDKDPDQIGEYTIEADLLPLSSRI